MLFVFVVWSWVKVSALGGNSCGRLSGCGAWHKSLAILLSTLSVYMRPTSIINLVSEYPTIALCAFYYLSDCTQGAIVTPVALLYLQGPIATAALTVEKNKFRFLFGWVSRVKH
jgi:hypothetical protein